MCAERDEGWQVDSPEAGPPLPLERVPRVWVLTDDRPGNATQSIGLAEALGWPFERRELETGPLAVLHNQILGASVLGLRMQSIRKLAPPWPDLVIAAGRRTAPPARWIKEQSGGRTRVVLLGRKAANPTRNVDFAMIPHYAHPVEAPNLLRSFGVVTRVRDEALVAAAESWGQRFLALPAPRIGVLVGGTSGLHRLPAEVGRDLGLRLREVVAETGGSVFATTSRRTPKPAAESLREALGADALVHDWSKDAEENPFLAILALCDALVVTDDSESMLAEACSTGTPVYIYALPRRRRGPLVWLGGPLMRAAFSPGAEAETGGAALRRKLARAIYHTGLIRPIRDMEALRTGLIAEGYAQPFETKLTPFTPRRLDDVSRVAERVRALFAPAKEH